MKAREPRRKVLIDARLRHGRGWADARILDLSDRGLMARAEEAPERGTYIEICRGAHRIVAQVVWVKDGRFGARSQDAIAVNAVASGADATLPNQSEQKKDRRSPRRQLEPNERRERSRRWSRRLEFAAVAAFGCAAAFLAFDTVRDTLAAPLGQIEARLGARN